MLHLFSLPAVLGWLVSIAGGTWLSGSDHWRQVRTDPAFPGIFRKVDFGYRSTGTQMAVKRPFKLCRAVDAEA